MLTHRAAGAVGVAMAGQDSRLHHSATEPYSAFTWWKNPIAAIPHQRSINATYGLWLDIIFPVAWKVTILNLSEFSSVLLVTRNIVGFRMTDSSIVFGV